MDQSLRLPPIRCIDTAHSCATASQPNAWTAINHRPNVPGPVSPRAQPSNPQPDTLPPPLRQHHHGERQLDRQNLSLPSIAPSRSGVPSVGRSPCFSPDEHRAAVEKPITPERQDSLIASSAPSQVATVTPPTSTSFQLGRSPEVHHRNLLRDSVTHPLTPPSDSSSSSTATAPTTHLGRASAHSSASRGDGQQEIPPSLRAQQERFSPAVQHWEHRLSDSARFTTAALPHTTLFENESSTMPPPPVPAPASTSPQHASRDMLDALNAMEERREDRCAYCLATWRYPLMDIASHRREAISNTTPQQMSKGMEAISEYIKDYNARKNADYERWKHFHFGGHCHCPDPQAGSKRKPDGSSDLDLPPSKSYRHSSESPPTRHTRLTPPPEQALRLGSPSASSSATEFIYRSRQGRAVPISHDTAVVTGLDGVPPPSRYEPSTNDPSNMWAILKGEESLHQ
ncbi:hypothetical protein BU23DRAFT_195408 [Bimuria novae-zelandiae CBS 107.79]|uniref:Uncharacterized protein n=1 Tax=Bimuria novae-zelandiae CBS 107.79 TaxID=1447943 RepID=A0A6A5V247_9PLEO|nr:hypothetical protein BU23DRAFT_195408 [Bimuria novae-zelandiae CBS 107.79]